MLKAKVTARLIVRLYQRFEWGVLQRFALFFKRLIMQAYLSIPSYLESILINYKRLLVVFDLKLVMPVIDKFSSGFNFSHTGEVGKIKIGFTWGIVA